MQFNQNKALTKAEKLAEDFDAKEAEEFAQKNTHKSWYADFKLLYDMVTDSNFEIDMSTYLAIAGALAYVIFPVDIIPDFIPGVGFIDDVFVVGVVMKNISEEIERYRTYKRGVCYA
jgi:uncharacterized membrane protein YkvA (DUF1232 family)